MGGKIKVKKIKNVCGEDIGEISSSFSSLKGIDIEASFSPYLIDEYPILSIAASQASGITRMKGLSELRHKESDRIISITRNLKKIGFNAFSKKDDIQISGAKKFHLDKQIKIKTYDDHRIAMSFKILSLLYKNKIKIDNEKCIAISYPNFDSDLQKLIKKS